MDDRERRRLQRQKELEEKKRRLQKLRAEKESSMSQTVEDTPAIDKLGTITTVEDLLKTLEHTSIATKLTDAAAKQEAASSSPADTSDESSTTQPSSQRSPSPTALSPRQLSPSYKTGGSAMKPLVLSVQLNVVVHDIAPKEVEVYSRAIQTEDSATCTSEGTEEEEEPSTVERQTTDIEKKDSVETSEETVAAPSSASEEPTTIIELSEEEKKNVMQSNEFVRFFSKASRRLERALFVGDQWDIMLDYSEADSETTEAKREDKVHLQTTLFDERWCKHRAVTDVTCSPKHADLVAASYSANEAGTHDPDGVVCVWSVQNMLQRPEFVFNCQSPVMSCLLPKYHPTLLVGGTYSGQIVLWDTRARNTPVQRTPLSSIGHTHPVYSLSVVGTQNANNLVSVSTDGRMCVWSFDSLLQPLEVLELRNRQSKSVTGSGNVAPTCIDFPDGEVNQFFTGSEEGVAYQAYRHGSKSGVDEQYCGHKGPITGISFHPAQGSIDFSDLFLTSSMDWSCKLWSRKDTKPLKSFEDTGDYVYDVCWSPTHPALFASVDGTGSLLLWNLNEDTEAPVVRQPIGSRSLNCLCWTHSGKKIAVGDSAGVLSILDLGEMGTPRVDDWERMQATLSEFAVAPQGQEGPSSDFVV